MPHQENPRLCEIADCIRPARSEAHRFCTAHHKRMSLGHDMRSEIREYGMDGLERLCFAALEYADVDSEDDDNYRRARIRLRFAAIRYVDGGRKRAERG
jgi:hypothetical protein